MLSRNNSFIDKTYSAINYIANNQNLIKLRPENMEHLSFNKKR
jgi:hypothetical protein